ncbi:MAG TPA: cob(I)yrinic acid a,c-diamide adenosyltransferase [Gemmatimonadota bacterium]|nr:cob(I)yrinic acid a,c-diamide adenosyltransferase [Gemmatimonadota bacterium]
MKIYTKTGDGGETALFGSGRVSKASPRVAAYGDIDELNAWLGAARAWCVDAQVRAALERVQAELFVVGAILATPNPTRRKGDRFRLAEDRIAALESEIDAWVDELDELQSFILPGGGKAAALIHLARAACRRAERAIVGLEADDLPDTLIPYVNRLSDWLFTCARTLNAREGIAETPW